MIEKKSGKLWMKAIVLLIHKKRRYHRGFELSTDKLIIFFVQSLLQRHPSKFRITNEPTAICMI